MAGAAGETVLGGPYTISATLAPTSVLSNYSITYNTASLTISTAPLIVTATNESMTQGGTVPALTYTYTGLVNGEHQRQLFRRPGDDRHVVEQRRQLPDHPGDAGRDRQLHDRHVQSRHTHRHRTSLPPNGTIYVLDPTAGGALTLSGSAEHQRHRQRHRRLELVERHHDQRRRLGEGRRHPGRRRRQEERQPDAQSPAGDRQPGRRRPARRGCRCRRSLADLTNYGSKSIGGSTTTTLQPGIYSKISVSGAAQVTLAAGTYVIQGGGFSASGSGVVTIGDGTSIILEGGGMSVSGAAAVSGTEVTVFNFGTAYNGTTDGGSFGPITLSGSGSVSLTPPSSGTYAGILIFQGRDNTKALTFSGAAMQGITGMIYAPAAQLIESGSAQVGSTSHPISMVVDTLTLSGAAIANGLTLVAVVGNGRLHPGPDPRCLRHEHVGPGLPAPLDGTGQTIAIVDAYDDPAIFTALDAFDSQFSLTDSGPSLYDQYGPASSFLTVLNQDGQSTSLPATDPSGSGVANWEVEEALDVEWVHAMAPGAQIILVEANSQSLSDLMASVATAASQPGVSVVSMSWGFAEGQAVFAADEAMYDRRFQCSGRDVRRQHRRLRSGRSRVSRRIRPTWWPWAARASRSTPTTRTTAKRDGAISRARWAPSSAPAAA